MDSVYAGRPGTTFELRITGVVLAGYVFAPADGVTRATTLPVP